MSTLSSCVSIKKLSSKNQRGRAFSGVCILVFRVLVVVATVGIRLSNSAQNEFVIPSNIGCACLGDTLTYRCTAVGAGSTVWEGTAFECVGNSITLRHTRFNVADGVSGDCNNGDIRLLARSIGVDNDCYTSQLSVFISEQLDRRSILCTHDFGTGLETIGTSTLNVIEATFSPPNVRLADVQEGTLIFSWDSLSPNCESVNYRIISSCGTCPNNTNSMSVNCSDLQLSRDARECTFKIQAVLCGDTSNPSDPVMVTLKLPDVPDILRVIPVYSNINNTLAKILAVINETVDYNITNGISGSVRNYNIDVTSNSEVVFSSRFTPTCMDGRCEEFIGIFQCPSLAHVNVTFSAANKLGLGPMSDTTTLSCNNGFVEVNYDSAASTITCFFLNQRDMVSCHVQYGKCQFELMFVSRGNSTGSNVTLNIPLIGSGLMYCYIVTASNGTHIVMVEGTISITGGRPSIASTVIIVLIVVIAALISIVLAILVPLIVFRRKYQSYRELFNLRSNPLHDIDDNALRENDAQKVSVETKFDDTAIENEELPVESRFNLKQIDLAVRLIHIQQPTELSTYLKDNDYPPDFVCAYEFLEVEDISEKEKIIFCSKNTTECFYPNVDKDTLHKNSLFGDGVLPPSFDNYTIYIESTNSGSRCLQKGSILVYKQSSQLEVQSLPTQNTQSPKQARESLPEKVPQERPSPKQAPLKLLVQQQHPMICVDVTKFAMRKVPSECTLKEFCGQCNPQADIHSVFFELGCDVEIETILDIILVDKKTHMIYTGTSALIEAKKYFKSADINPWRIFVFKEFEEEFRMKKDMCVLYQIEEQMKPSPVHPKSPLVCIDKEPFAIIKQVESCTLENFRKSHGLEATVHSVFLKLKKIGEDTQVLDVILEDKDTKELYTCHAASDVVKWYIRKNAVTKQWRIFVMADFEDTFIIETRVLYRRNTKQHPSNNLLPICSGHFKKQELQESYTIGDFRATLPQETYVNVFVELQKDQKFDAIVDVILMKKDTEKLYSGPYAHHMVKEYLNGNQIMDANKWQAFVLYKTEMNLQKKASVLHQDLNTESGRFRVLEVDDKNDVQMMEFIKQHYEDGKVFYELKQEDLLSYREILHVPLELFDHGYKVGSIVELQSSATFFYGIHGAPGWGVIPQEALLCSKKFKVFVQSTSRGSRCLKKGTLILYKVEKEDISVEDHTITL